MSVPKPVLREALTEPAVALPIGHTATVAAQRRVLSLRAWVMTAVLFLVPLTAYWPATVSYTHLDVYKRQP